MKRQRSASSFVPFAAHAHRNRGPANPKRRTARTGRSNRNRIVSVPRGKLAFPQEMRTTLRYVVSYDLEPTSATAAGKSLLANGLYDPEVSVGGHQPRGFDQYTDLYHKFTVRSSKLSVTFSYEGYLGPAGTTSTGQPNQAIEDAGGDVVAVPGAICLIHKAVAPNVTGTIENFQEKDKTKWTQIVPSSGPKTISTVMRASEFFGKDFLVGADGYTGDDSADPANKLYYHIMAGLNSNEYPNQIKVRANCVVEYDVVWTEPKQLAAS